jgi:ankyrin repeat protein
MAKLLLRFGAALDAQNNRGRTPLHYCFTYGFGGLGQYLIGKGADAGVRDADGRACFSMEEAAGGKENRARAAAPPLTAR